MAQALLLILTWILWPTTSCIRHMPGRFTPTGHSIDGCTPSCGGKAFPAGPTLGIFAKSSWTAQWPTAASKLPPVRKPPAEPHRRRHLAVTVERVSKFVDNSRQRVELNRHYRWS